VGRSPLALLLALCLASFTGCGSDDDSKTTKTAPASGPVPATIVGTYTTTLRRSDLPANPPPELTHGSSTWKLTIANSGGDKGNHRIFTIANAQLGPLESSAFGASGDRIVIQQEECAAGGTEHFYDNEYRFAAAGRTLRFTKVRNSCADRVAETILTAEPWKRAG
jgi:hypothetical protein